MTEKEKMDSGQWYIASDEEIVARLNEVKDLLWRHNALRPSMMAERRDLLHQILGRVGENVFIVQPFYCDHGTNIEVGDNFFANFNFTVLDEGHVIIGDNVFIGPNVGIYTVNHPLDVEKRNMLYEQAKYVTIGNNVWIGGGVTICPGVKIGDNVTIGAGSVVVKDIPNNVVAVGNPAKVVKTLE